MGLVFGSAVAHTYPKSGQVASPHRITIVAVWISLTDSHVLTGIDDYANDGKQNEV